MSWVMDTARTDSESLTHIRTGGGYGVFQIGRPPRYYVIQLGKWMAAYCASDATGPDALYAAAERFDTLEQAMLYFEVVKN